MYLVYVLITHKYKETSSRDFSRFPLATAFQFGDLVPCWVDGVLFNVALTSQPSLVLRTCSSGRGWKPAVLLVVELLFVFVCMMSLDLSSTQGQP